MSEQNWIIWQKACDAMQDSMLKELRRHMEDNAVTTHHKIDALLSEASHPEMPDNLPKCP